MTWRGSSAKDQGLQLVGHLCLPGSSQSISLQEHTLMLTLVLAGKQEEMREDWYKALS